LQAEIRSKNVLAQVEKDNKEIKARYRKFCSRNLIIQKEAWEKEVVSLRKVSELKNKIDKLQNDLDRAERNLQYEEAGKIKYSILPGLSQKN
jgi:ATP-dependent Clp protease ATP-binding subunit ClpB